MKTTFLRTAIGVWAAVLLGRSAWAQQEADPPPVAQEAKEDEAKVTLSQADQRFVYEAAVGGLSQAAMGRLAHANGGTSEVRALGARLVLDHDDANAGLEKAVVPHGVLLPTRIIDKEHHRAYDALIAKQGAEFDAAFLRHVIDANARLITLLKKELRSGEAARLKDFAAQWLPVLEQHQSLAKGLAKAKPLVI